MSKRILVAEDDMIIQMFISRVLTNAGFEVVAEARNNEQVLEMAKEHKPELILLDIGLDGEKDGIQTAIELKEIMDVPFMFLTGNSDEATIEKAKKCNPVGFTFKPIDEVRLVKEINKL